MSFAERVYVALFNPRIVQESRELKDLLYRMSGDVERMHKKIRRLSDELNELGRQ